MSQNAPGIQLRFKYIPYGSVCSMKEISHSRKNKDTRLAQFNGHVRVQ